jgi:hypothetical protein
VLIVVFVFVLFVVFVLSVRAVLHLALRFERAARARRIGRALSRSPDRSHYHPYESAHGRNEDCAQNERLHG